MRVRGLKLVTSHLVHQHSNVAPHAGAWIETHNCVYLADLAVSHPMRVRGLKHNLGNLDGYTYSRTPCGCVD